MIKMIIRKVKSDRLWLAGEGGVHWGSGQVDSTKTHKELQQAFILVARRVKGNSVEQTHT